MKKEVVIIYRRNGHTTGGVAKYVVNLLQVQNNGRLHNIPIQGYKYNTKEHGYLFTGNAENIYQIVKEQYTVKQGIEL